MSKINIFDLNHSGQLAEISMDEAQFVNGGCCFFGGLMNYFGGNSCYIPQYSFKFNYSYSNCYNYAPVYYNPCGGSSGSSGSGGGGIL
jgi:hypothetical protein